MAPVVLDSLEKYREKLAHGAKEYNILVDLNAKLRADHTTLQQKLDTCTTEKKDLHDQLSSLRLSSKFRVSQLQKMLKEADIPAGPIELDPALELEIIRQDHRDIVAKKELEIEELKKRVSDCLGGICDFLDEPKQSQNDHVDNLIKRLIESKDVYKAAVQQKELQVIADSVGLNGEVQVPAETIHNLKTSLISSDEPITLSSFANEVAITTTPDPLLIPLAADSQTLQDLNIIGTDDTSLTTIQDYQTQLVNARSTIQTLNNRVSTLTADSKPQAEKLQKLQALLLDANKAMTANKSQTTVNQEEISALKAKNTQLEEKVSTLELELGNLTGNSWVTQNLQPSSKALFNSTNRTSKLKSLI